MYIPKLLYVYAYINYHFSTSRQRELFMKFADGNDTATREHILQGYERRMGDESTEEHREKINNLPIDSDCKVTYEVFLRNYLLEREQVGAGPSCWNMSAKEKKYFDCFIDVFGITFLHYFKISKFQEYVSLCAMILLIKYVS